MFKDRNTLIGFLLIFGILIAFSIISTPSQEELAEKARKEDSLRIVKDNQKQITEVTAETQQVGVVDSIGHNQNVENAVEQVRNLPFHQSPNFKEEIVYIENSLIKIGISNKGGNINTLQLKDFLKFDKTPLMLFDENLHQFGLNFFANNNLINTNNLRFKPVFYNFQVSDTLVKIDAKSNDTLKFGMRLYPFQNDTVEQNSWLEFQYFLAPNSYMFNFNIEFHNLRDYLPANTSFVDFQMNSEIKQQEKSLKTERDVTTVFYRFLNDEVEFLSKRKDDFASLKTPIHWISFKQQFFSFTLISPTGFQAAEIQVATNEEHADTNYLRTMNAAMSLPIPMDNSKIFNIPLQIYSGPNHYKTMKDYGIELERQIPLGWSFFLLQWINVYAVIPVFNYLEGFNLNYGIIILILTILLKIVLFPIAYKTYLSTARMKVLKPEIDEIAKKFPKKEDNLKKQQANMDLYKKAGVNPMAGCLPMLLQFPILIALFRFFPASIELRQEAFLWADDLSSYDSILELGFHIPFYGSHVSLFTLLMTISTIIYTKLNSNMMTSTQTMPGMKTMLYLMPIMFLGFFNSFSSALSYYYLLTNLITFAQMAIFNKMIDPDKILAKIQANKKKPVKKSGFQKKLEDLAKIQQQQQQKRK